MIIELVGIILLFQGIIYEIIVKADIGYLIITAGAALIAGGGAWFTKAKPYLFTEEKKRLVKKSDQ